MPASRRHSSALPDSSPSPGREAPPARARVGCYGPDFDPSADGGKRHIVFTEWTGTAWAGVSLATHESGKVGPILLIVALIIFAGLAAIMVFLRREGRQRRKRMERDPEGAAPDQPGAS